MRALCVGRHRYLSEHLARYFGELGVETASAVGLRGAVEVARGWTPDVVLCDFDVLVTRPLDAWETDALLSHTPVVAVSMTRTPDDSSLINANEIAGLLYLPALGAAEAVALVRAAVRGRAARVAGVAAPRNALPLAWPAAAASTRAP